MSPSVLALVPARGGSKSVPRKNVLPIAGKPLITYSIEQALGASRITRTVVSTDDREIAEVARAAGAEVPFVRPSEYAEDDSTDFDVLFHALGWLAWNEGYVPDLVVHLRPTEPVRDVARIDRAIEAMLSHPEADSLRSVSVAEQSPFKMWDLEGPYLSPLLRVEGLREAHSMPRQRLPMAYRQNGYVDIVRSGTILVLGSICGERVLPFFVEHDVPGLDYLEQVAELERALTDPAHAPRIFTEERCQRHPA